MFRPYLSGTGAINLLGRGYCDRRVIERLLFSKIAIFVLVKIVFEIFIKGIGNRNSGRQKYFATFYYFIVGI